MIPQAFQTTRAWLSSMPSRMPRIYSYLKARLEQWVTGLPTALNPFVHYVACRWDYADTPKPSLLQDVALVRAASTGIELTAFPADWGPNENTGRVADLSPGLMADLGITTDDEVEVIYPWKG